LSVRKTTEDLARKLSEDGITSLPYHAGLDGDAFRSRKQRRFLRDEIRVVCATIAFGMGINKSKRPLRHPLLSCRRTSKVIIRKLAAPVATASPR